MALQVVYWQSTDQICCGRTLPIDVIICLDPSLVAQQSCPGGGVTNFPWPGISARLVDVYALNNDCNPCLIYRYTIQYDDTQLVPGAKLQTSDIQGMFCFGCLLQVVLASAGQEVSLLQNEDGSYTLTSQHGCQYTFTASGISVQDTETLDLHLVGNVLSGDVNVSAVGGNQISVNPDGLFVGAVPDFISGIVDTPSIDLTILPGDILAASTNIAVDAGNQIIIQPTGLFVSAPFIEGINNSSTVNLNVTLGTLTAGVILSPDAGNELLDLPNGLFAPSDFIQNVNDTATIDLDVTGNNLTANAIVSPDTGNILTALGNGLYVPTPGSAFIQSISDTFSVDLTVAATDLTADVRISASFGNQLAVAGDGLVSPLGAGITVSDTATVDMTLTAGYTIFADVNQVAIHTDGWIPATESWSAPSATTITVPTNATLKYDVGDKIRLVQDATTKYFYVIEVAATLLTVTAGDDFTLTGNPITDPYYSHSLSPVGFPQRFFYLPTFGGFSVDPATPEVQWSLFGKMAHLAISTGEGTSDDTIFTVSLLVPMFVPANNFSARGSGWSGTDNGTFAGNIMPTISSLAPTILQFFPDSGAVGWTAAGNKAVNATIDYPIT